MSTISIISMVVLMLMTLGSVPVLAQDPGHYKFEWADDTWLSRDGSILIYDKLEHAFAGLVIYGVLHACGVPRFLAFTLNALFWAAWEFKDGFLKDQKRYGWFAGDGCSWKDFTASTALPLVFFVIGL